MKKTKMKNRKTTYKKIINKTMMMIYKAYKEKEKDKLNNNKRKTDRE